MTLLPQASTNTPVTDLSGVVINQNESVTGFITEGFYQTLKLPDDYVRGEDPVIIPPLTGFQIFVNVVSGKADQAEFDWTFDRLDGHTWVTLANGSAVGAPLAGDTWVSAYFPSPVEIDQTWLTSTFRFTVPSFTHITAGYFTSPNPMTEGQGFLTGPGSGGPVLVNGQTAALRFRLLAGVADSGTDFLGNIYRSAITRSSADNVAIIGNLDTYWLSQPSPSQFAVQSLYFDLSVNDQAIVIDRMTLDPLTPGVYFHVYYSSDPTGPGVDSQTWDNLLWTPIYTPWQANRLTTFVFAEPVVTKYIKIEFSHLQARTYDPGLFQVPTVYRKYPKWVLDFFLARFATLQRELVASGIDVTYDALDLAYSYYREDIVRNVGPPPRSLTPEQQIRFLNQQNHADRVDPMTLGKIQVNFQPYTLPPGALGRLDSILGNYTASVASNNYSTEVVQTALGDTSTVSNLSREPMLIEKGFPVMFFHVPCRHTYRIAQALFERNLGYFAGVKSLTFHRDAYPSNTDFDQYNEVLVDGANLLINDWFAPVPLPRP